MCIMENIIGHRLNPMKASLEDTAGAVETLNLFGDLEMFGKDSLFEKVLDRTALRHGGGGSLLLRRVVEHPTTDVGRLLSRQREIARFSTAASAGAGKVLIEKEVDAVWMWDFLSNPDDEAHALFDVSYFSHWMLDMLNNSPTCLATVNIYKVFAAPLIGIVTPIMYFFVPYIIFRYRMGIRVSFIEYLKFMYSMLMSAGSADEPLRRRLTKYASVGFSLVFYFQGVFSSIEVSNMLRNVCESVSTHVRSVSMFAQGVIDEWEALWTLGSADAWRDIWPHLPALEVSGAEREVASVPLVLSKPPSLLDRYGTDLCRFKRISRDVMGTLLYRAYVMDAVHSMARTKMALSCMDTVYTLSDKPALELLGVWHPTLDPSSAVDNDWSFSDTSGRNAILTGPNAGGKSTLMKSVLLSVLLSQTVGFSPCRRGCRMTPFDIVSSHINVPDNQSRGESLFEAEMKRAKDIVDRLTQAKGVGSKVFVVMDEIFSSTNPIEGIAGATATARKLGGFDNAINIISTHYTQLARLAHDKATGFVAYKMPVEWTPGGKIQTPFRLQRGVSDQYVALEIMREAGVDADIVTDAINIKNELLSLRTTLLHDVGARRRKLQQRDIKCHPPAPDSDRQPQSGPAVVSEP